MSVVANVAINVDSRDAVSKLRQVEQASSKLDQTYQDLNGRLRDANGRFVKAGDAAQAASGKVNLLGNAVKNLAAQLVVADLARRFFKGFDEAEKAAAAVRTLGVDSKALEGQLLGVSNRLGGLYSQTQLLAASYDVASAGFANAADNAKILEASAKGATGGLSDINTVGNAVTSVLNAYGKSAAEAGVLIDGFIQTQNDGKIVLNEYAQQIGKLAPTAAAAGIGIQELNAAVATITAQGVPVESTFAGLNQALVAILKPSKEASDLAEALGIDFNEAGLRAKGFGGLLQEVKQKTGGSTTALVQLFGSVDALKAILPLVNDDLVKYNQNVQKQADVSGVADKATAELGGTVSAEVSKMINQIGNLTRSLDTVLGPALGGIVRLINVVIAEATRGINVLGQLFSLGKNTTILKGALESGDLRGAAAARIIPGVDELIGQQRRQQLQRQAGAGSGPLGLGFNAQKFAQLLKQQPEIQRLLGAGAAPAAGAGPSAGVDPAIQAVLDSLGQSGGKGSKGKSDAEKAAREAEKLAQELADLQGQVALKEKLFDIDKQIAIEKQRGSLVTAAALEMDKALEERQTRIAEITRSSADQATKNAQIKDATLEADQKIYAVQQAIKEQEAERTKSYEQIIADLDLELALKTATTEQEREQLRIASELAKLQGRGFTAEQIGAITARQSALGAPLTDAQKIEQRIGKLKEEIAELTNIGNIAITVADGIGAAFSQAFEGLISGSMTAKEALGNFFKSVGEMFVSMAAQIIAKQLVMITLQTILKALGLSGGSSGPVDLSGTRVTDLPVAQMPAGMAFAEGGFVTGPTNALIGEGGEPEYVIPASKMASAMAKYSAGASGEALLNDDGTGTSFTKSSAQYGTAQINISGGTLVFNDQNYVKADQIPAIISQSSKMGQAMAIKQLQMSATTRKKLGL